VPTEPETAPPSPSGSARERTDFPCVQCGAPTMWDPDADALACEHCGHARSVPRAEGSILERPLEDAGAAARGLGIDARAVGCRTCGAVVALEESSTATSCVFCGSAAVLPQEANRNALRPESLVPLDVGHKAAEESFRRWLKGLWFRPTALRDLKRFDAVGVYVPYWTFDARVRSDWSADSGTYYWDNQLVPVMRNGKLRMEMQRVRKVRWRPAWGQRDDSYDDLLVNASRGVPDDLARRLGHFDTKALVPYRPEYLAGWSAEEYQLDLEQGWNAGRQRIVELQEQRCGGDVPGDTYRNLRVSNQIDGVRWKHVLLPMWTLSYAYAGKRYVVLVHGQNGRVHGRAPWSWVKILLLVLLIALAALLVAGIAAVAGS
jgi:DNA-directed RNA polymerase subunit RPC12/RpoP